MPTGRVSVTTNGPTLLSGPLFVTLMFQSNSVPGTTSSSWTFHSSGYLVLWVFSSMRSAEAILVCAVTSLEVCRSQSDVGVPGYHDVVAVLMWGMVVPTPGLPGGGVATAGCGIAWNLMMIFLFTGRSAPVSQASFTASGSEESTVGSSVEISDPS